MTDITFPISKTINNVTVTITNIEINKKHDCSNCYDYQRKTKCLAKQSCNMSPGKYLIYTVVELIIANYSQKTFQLTDSSYTLVDCESFAHESADICYEVGQQDKKFYISNVKKNTKVKAAVIFPELPKDIWVSRFIVEPFGETNFDFSLAPYTDTVEQELSTIHVTPELSYEFKHAKSELNILKEDIFSRLNNILQNNQKIQLDNSINTHEYRLKLLLEDLPPSERDIILSELNKAMSEYRLKVDTVNPLTQTNRIATEGTRPDLGDTYFRSAWEANIARILNHIGTKWSYEKERFSLGDIDYLPDFFIDSKNTIVEVKGFWDNQSAQRVDSFIRTYPNKNFVIIDKDNYPDINLIFTRYEPILNWEDTPCPQGEATLVTVVGLQFIQDKSVLAQLHIGDSLKLVAEPDNQYDSFAIAVYTHEDKIVGHIEKQFATIYSLKIKEGMVFNVVIETIKPKILKVKISRTNWDTPLIPKLLRKNI